MKVIHVILICLCTYFIGCTQEKSYLDVGPGVSIGPPFRPVAVYLHAGQSNARSAVGPSGLPDSLTGPIPNVYIYNQITDSIEQYEAGVNSMTTAYLARTDTFVGQEIIIAKNYVNDHPGEDIIIVKHCIGGTALCETAASDWNVNAEEQYDYYETVITKAFLKISELTKYPKIIGLGWVHGEEDGKDSLCAESWDENMSDLVDGYRTQTGSNFQVVATRVNSNRAYLDEVRASIEAYSDARYQWVDIDALPLGIVDNTHYALPQILDMGNIMYDALESGGF